MEVEAPQSVGKSFDGPSSSDPLPLQGESPPTPCVEMFGNPEDGMALIHPSSSDAKVVEILRRMDHLLQQRQVHKELDRFLLDKKDGSIRRIQGNRIEIFLEATDKITDCFDDVLGKRLPAGAKKRVLDYARKQANQDPRQANMYDYGNFSLIVNFAKCKAQAPHIDLIKPNYQFGLVVTEGSPGTLFFESEKHIRSVGALAEHWRTMAMEAGDDVVEMPPKLTEAIRRDNGAMMLLDCFGDVLDSERYILSKMKSKQKLPTGTVLSLPGSIVHAGPSSTEFRAVIFFSGWKRGSDIAAYDPDVQYSGTMLAGHLTSILWRREGIDFPERLFLLHRLAQYAEGSTVTSMSGHFGPGKLSDFVGNIEKQTYRPRVTRNEYIQLVAQDLGLGVPGDAMSEPEKIDISNFVQISEHDLYTRWDENEVHVIIYRRTSDGKLILRYPTEGEDNPDEYEGHRDDECFQLIMNGTNKHDLFNGSNGVLLDSDGDEVKVCQGKTKRN